MSVRHHEQLFAHQQREMYLMQSFQVAKVLQLFRKYIWLLNNRKKINFSMMKQSQNLCAFLC